MDTSYSPWQFVLDMDGDGRFTILDVGLWFARAFFLPGDSLIWALTRYAPDAAAFLVLGTSDYGGLFSAIVSVAAWGAAAVLVGTAHAWILEIDRRMTEGLRNTWREARRRLRVAGNRLRARFR